MLFADVVHDAARTWVLALKGVGYRRAGCGYGHLEEGVTAGLETDGIRGHGPGPHPQRGPALPGPGAHREHRAARGAHGRGRGRRTHRGVRSGAPTLYGHRTNDPIELVTLRVRGTGRVPRPELPRLTARRRRDGVVGTRRVQGAAHAHDYRVVRRSALTAGSVVTGPAIVEEHTATTVLHPGDVGRVGTHGELDITIAPGSRSMGEPTTTVDSITVEVIRHRLLSASQEMMRNLQRTAHSTIVYEIRDFGLGIYDAKGALLAEAPGLAIFTRANDYSLEKAIEFLGVENIEPGDCILLNYPYWSSAHTLDVAAFSPIHHDGELLGFTATRIHWLDLKQKDAGYVLDSTDMHQEGIFFPCTKIERRGVIQQDIVNLITFNSRYPEQTVGDMRAQIAACRTGERRVERDRRALREGRLQGGLHRRSRTTASGWRVPASRSCPRAPGPRTTSWTTTASTAPGADGVHRHHLRRRDARGLERLGPAGEGPHQPALRHDAGALRASSSRRSPRPTHRPPRATSGRCGSSPPRAT